MGAQVSGGGSPGKATHSVVPVDTLSPSSQPKGVAQTVGIRLSYHTKASSTPSLLPITIKITVEDVVRGLFLQDDTATSAQWDRAPISVSTVEAHFGQAASVGLRPAGRVSAPIKGLRCSRFSFVLVVNRQSAMALPQMRAGKTKNRVVDGAGPHGFVSWGGLKPLREMPILGTSFSTAVLPQWV